MYIYIVDFEAIRRLVIVSIFSDDQLLERLVLKGGNAISLVYGFGSRTSLDIDCSLDGDFDIVEEASARLERALQRRFAETGCRVFDFRFEKRPSQDRADAPESWGGYTASFKIINVTQSESVKNDLEGMRRNSLKIGPSQERVFAIDMSKHEYCVPKREKEMQDFTIYVYSPAMISLEKLRAICQQMDEYSVQRNRSPRARDFYDIHAVLTGSGIDWAGNDSLQLAMHIFAAKNVPPKLISLIPNYREFHRQDWAAVEQAVSEKLRTYDFYFDFVLEESEKLKAFWEP